MCLRPERPSDATPTYRGYRRQALYALGRLLDDGLADGATLRPEGIEDLAIYDARGRLVEVVQVKDHSAELTFSELSPGFFTRAAERVRKGGDARTTLATFGPVGRELTQAIEGSEPGRRRVAAKLAEHLRASTSSGSTKRSAPGGPDLSLAARTLDQVRLHPVDEGELTAAVAATLSATAVGVDVQSALDLLAHWMLLASEQRRPIDRQDALERLAAVGSFLAGRIAFYADWHTSIVPLTQTVAGDPGRLQREFLQGGRVSYAHIVAGVDVIRPRLLQAIQDGFGDDGDRRVVIVHSASGQGKTTLAYRYLHEMVPDALRLEALSAEGADHARRMALAISSQAGAIGVPTVVYVDVRPGDVHWVELVRELATQELIRVLVTIREEDWQRANVSPSDFLWSDVPLDFEELEARQIYDALSSQGRAGPSIDFADAWTRFGHRKTLFEFVYFLTQEQTLADRVANQVTALEDRVRSGECQPAELVFLRLVAVASAYEARLDLAALAAHSDLAAPKRTVRLFEDEYLVRLAEDSGLVDGYHAIRSTILAERLTDPVVWPWGKAAAQTLPMMDEGDLEAFLLTAFSRRPEDREPLVDGLADLQPRTWTGVTGVLRALLWLGAAEYADRNLDLINKAREFSNGLWWSLLDWDVGGAGAPNQTGLMDWDSLGEMFADAASRSRDLRSRQSDKQEVFRHARRWLEACGTPSLPSSPSGWLALAEAAYWTGRLDVDSRLRDLMAGDAVSAGFEALPMHQVADFARAVRTLSPELYEDWFDNHGAQLLAQVRREAGIVHLEDNGISATSHFVVRLDPHESLLHQDRPDKERIRVVSKTLSDERYRLVSEVLPDRQTCGAVGYGHRSSLVPADYDESVTEAGPEFVRPASWSAQLNGVAQNAVEYRFRLETWDDYFGQFRELRKSITDCLAGLRGGLVAAAASGSTDVFGDAPDWDRRSADLGAALAFPRDAVDEWGFVSDSGNQPAAVQKLAERYKSTGRMGGLGQAVAEYCRTWHNFFTQVPTGFLVQWRLRRAGSAAERERGRQQLGSQGINVDLLRLSVINGCDALAALQTLQAVLRQLPGRLAETDDALEQRELAEAWAAVEAWADFAEGHRPAKGGRGHRRSEPLRDSLGATRRRLKAKLRELRNDGVKASVLKTVARWEDKPTLWLTCDIDTPLLASQALVLLWLTLHQVFEPDRHATIPRQAIDLTWQEIVVVPLVRGRALSRQVHPNFRTTVYRDEPLTEDDVWLLYPATVEPPLWQELGIPCWPIHPLGEALERLTSRYVEIFARVDHMADFTRLPDDLDELGTELLRDHLQAEASSVSQSLAECRTALVEVIGGWSEAGIPEWTEAAAMLADLWQSVEVLSADQPEARLTLADTVVWRDKLLAGFEQLGQVGQLIHAGIIGP